MEDQQQYIGDYQINYINQPFVLEQRKEEPEKKFKCELCHCSYTKSFTLSQHIRRCHKKETPYQCTYCPFAGVIKSELTAHLRKHGVYDKAYPCRHCNEVFFTPVKRRTHETTHSGLMFACKLCNYTTYSINNYSQHINKHANSVQCRFCERTFTNTEKLNAHELTHPQMNMGDVSDPKALNVIHYSTELNTTKTCSVCNFEGTSLKTLKLHVIKCHSDLLGTNDYNKKHFPKWNDSGECPICRRVIRTPTERFTHLLNHIGIVPYKCHLCDYKTSWIRNLKHHFNNHRNPTNWNCLDCGQTYERRCNYIFHIRKEHKAIKPAVMFLCDICGKKFSNKSSFKKHLKKPHVGIDILSKHKRKYLKKGKLQGSNEQSNVNRTKRTYRQKTEKKERIKKLDLEEDPPSFSDPNKTITAEDVRKKYMKMSEMSIIKRARSSHIAHNSCSGVISNQIPIETTQIFSKTVATQANAPEIASANLPDNQVSPNVAIIGPQASTCKSANNSNLPETFYSNQFIPQMGIIDGKLHAIKTVPLHLLQKFPGTESSGLDFSSSTGSSSAPRHELMHTQSLSVNDNWSASCSTTEAVLLVPQTENSALSVAIGETRQEMPVVGESSKEFIVDTNIGERKIKEKVVYANGRKKIIIEDCGLSPKCITLP